MNSDLFLGTYHVQGNLGGRKRSKMLLPGTPSKRRVEGTAPSRHWWERRPFVGGQPGVEWNRRAGVTARGACRPR